MTIKKMLAAIAILATMSVGAATLASTGAGAKPAATRSSAATTELTHMIIAKVPCTSLGLPRLCTLRVKQFRNENGKVYARGTVSRLGKSIPFRAALQSEHSVVPWPSPSKGIAQTSGSGDVQAQAAAVCQILNLVIGPLHLNLLGLVVDLNQVHLVITAVPGAGNLLGNLLCAVAGLLDGTGTPTAIAQLLNQILSLL